MEMKNQPRTIQISNQPARQWVKNLWRSTAYLIDAE
jgi:hypothetical protein